MRTLFACNSAFSGHISMFNMYMLTSLESKTTILVYSRYIMIRQSKIALLADWPIWSRQSRSACRAVRHGQACSQTQRQ